VGSGWKKLPALFRYISSKDGQAIKRDIAKAVRDFAEEYKKALIRGLASEGKAIGASWPSHQPKYARWRKRKGAKGGIGVFTGLYLQALGNMKVVQKKYMISLTFQRGDLNRKAWKKGLSLGQYSMVFEYGSSKRNIAARPLWQDAYRHIGGNQRVVRKVMGGVGRRLNKMGIKVRQSQ